MSNLASVREVDLNPTYPEHSQKKYHWNKQERTKRKDQPWRRLATKNKIAQVKGWNLPTYREKRSIENLLEQLGEYSYLTGKHLGTGFLTTLDLDIQREEFPINRINRLFKNAVRLLDYLQVSYNLTKKGLHVDILTPEPLDNGTIYWTDKLGKKWNIGSIQSLGKYVVGEGSNKAFIQAGKWYWKVKSNEELKTTLNKFFFEFKEAVQPVDKVIEDIQKPKSLTSPDFKSSIIQVQVRILSKQKVPWLTDLWKVFYLNCQSKQTGYFLANDYTQKNLTDLNLGAVKNIRLIQGRKHIFYSRIL